jgi:hypothetical protein
MPDPIELAPAMLREVYGDLERLHERLALRGARLRSLVEALRSISSSGVRDSIVGIVETTIDGIEEDLTYIGEFQELVRKAGLAPEDA